MNIIKEVGNAITVEDNGNCSLGLNTKLVKKGGASRDFSIVRKDSGYIYKDNSFTQFTLDEITEIDNKIILYSKDLNCGIKPLLTDNGRNTESINLLISALIKLKETGVTIDNLSLNMFYYTENNNLLIMPPRLIEYIDQRSNLTALEQSVTRINHPDLKGEKSIMFSIGVLLYQEFTGEYPVDYTTVEELRDKIRRGRILDPRWSNILLSDSVYNLLISLIFQMDEDETLITTNKKLTNILDNGKYRDELDIPTEERTSIAKAKKKFVKKDWFRAFIIKNRTTLAITGAISVILISLFGTMIKSAIEPPQTTGFTQRQVLESYFNAFQSLDTYLLDDVLKSGVRKTDEREISTMYVTTKMRTQVSGADTGIKSPKEWLALPKDEQIKTDVYGIYNLSIEKLEENKFRVNYEKWFSNPVDSDLSTDIVLKVDKIIREEIFTLTKTKYSYIISDINTISERVE